jgi:predicted DNA-binding protein YlxM (UPF0122 family)
MKDKPKPKTLLTEISGPTPDNKPELKLIDLGFGLYHTRNHARPIPNCIEFLRKELPYWSTNQLRYPDESVVAAKSVYYTLIALSAKSEKLLPPVLDTIDGLIQWVSFVYLQYDNLAPRADLPDAPDISNQAKAAGLFFDNPDLSMTEIAKIIGVSRQRLYEMPRLKEARKVFKEIEKASRTANIKMGTKDPETGKMEAWSRYKQKDIPDTISDAETG